MKKILLTGGHAATTAISVIEELIRRYGKDGIDVSWIGPKSSLEGKRLEGLELKIFPKIGVKSYLINAGRLQRKFTRWTIPSIIKIPIGFVQSIFFLSKIRPSVTLSFGGFAAFPVVFASWILGIPVIVHEQTSVLGLANKLSTVFAKEILLSREESTKYSKNRNIKVVGNPVMTQITEIEAKEKIGTPPTVFVMGGSRGSERINNAIYLSLDKLLTKYRLIHITGEGDFERFKDVNKVDYKAYSIVDPLEMDNLYREADIVVARSGANTTSELLITKRPAILIPIPWSHLNEQEENARKLEKIGFVRILNQGELSGDKLVEEIGYVVKNWDQMISKVKNFKSEDIYASRKVVDCVSKYLK